MTTSSDVVSQSSEYPCDRALVRPQQFLIPKAYNACKFSKDLQPPWWRPKDCAVDFVFKLETTDIVVTNKRIGSGGQGQAHRVQTSRGPMIWKEDFVDAATYPTARIKYRNILDIALRVKSPNVVRPLAIIIDYDANYELVPLGQLMEDLGDTSLQAWFEQWEPQPPPNVTLADVVNRFYAITVDIAKGLDALHVAGKIHMDIKPSNIMVTDTRAVIIDLDLAADDNRQRDYCGTKTFMAPEVTREATLATSASDIWSFGATIKKVLTKIRAAFDATAYDQLAADKTTLLWKLSKLAQDCMAELPNQRISAHDVVRDFKGVAVDVFSRDGHALLSSAQKILSSTGNGDDTTVDDRSNSDEHLRQQLVDAGGRLLKMGEASAWQCARKIADFLDYLQTASSESECRHDETRLFVEVLLDSQITSHAARALQRLELPAALLTPFQRFQHFGLYLRTWEAVGLYQKVDDELPQYREAFRQLEHPHDEITLERLTVEADLIAARKSKESLFEARQLYDEALVIQRRLSTVDDLDVATILRKKANVVQSIETRDALKEAIGIYDEVLAIEASFGKEHIRVAKTMSSKATALLSLGSRVDVECAVALFNQALALEKRQYGSKHQSLALSIANIANATQTLGGRANWNKAIELYDEAISVKRKAYGDKHPIVAKSIANKANALQKFETREKLHQALDLYDEALEIEIEAFGRAHPEVASTLCNKASARQSLGTREDFEAALKLFDEAIDIEKATLGPKHRKVAATMSNKANTLQEFNSRDRFLEAVALYDAALKIEREALGDDDPHVASTLCNKACALQSMEGHENVNQALRLYDEAISILERALGPRHHHVATAIGNKASALQHFESRESLTEAVALYDKALDILRSTLGDNHPDVAGTLCNKANALQSFDTEEKLREGLKLFDEAIRIYKSEFGDDHPSVASVTCNKANTLQHFGDRDSFMHALQLYDEALSMQKRYLGHDHADVASTLCNKACLLQSFGDEARATEAITLYDQAIAIEIQAYGPRHPKVAATMVNKANILQDRSTTEKQQAIKLYEDALVIERDSLGNQHRSVAATLCNFATALLQIGGNQNVAKAISLYDEALDIETATLGPTHRAVASTLGNKATALTLLEKYHEAVEVYNQAINVANAALGPHHPDVVGIRCNKAHTLVQIGTPESLVSAREIYSCALPLLRKAHGGDDHPDVHKVLRGQSVCHSQLRFAELRAAVGATFEQV